MDPIKILFVDDEPMILQGIERLMRSERFTLFFAGSVFDALQLLVNEDIDIVVSDYDMPAVNGLELFDLLRKERSEIVRIMMTGRLAMNSWESGIDNGSVQRLIEKPWGVGTLKRVLDEAADAVRMRRRIAPDLSETRRFRRPLSVA